jgi:hypothetical protein
LKSFNNEKNAQAAHKEYKRIQVFI